MSAQPDRPLMRRLRDDAKETAITLGFAFTLVSCFFGGLLAVLSWTGMM